MTQDSTITLHIYDNIVEAEIAKEKLSANGIESYLENDNVMGLNPIGGVELKVFLKDEEVAKKLLA